MKVIGVIPARLQSSRLPEKALVDIAGLPMIVHVLKRAQMAKSLQEVYVATDNKRIKDIVTDHGGKAIMTSADHQTGTDRIAEAIKDMEVDIVVDIQGDEPLVLPEHIDKAVEPLLADAAVQMSVLVTPFSGKNSPSDIKAVLGKNNDILYCSRTDLPSDARNQVEVMWKMCFVVPIRKSFLLEFASWEPSPLEKVEYIEHLRVLENGYSIRAVPIPDGQISVDTIEDLTKARMLMEKDRLKERYGLAR